MEQKLFTKNFTLLVLGQASSLVGIGVFWMTCSPGHQIFLRTAGSPVKMK